MSYETATPKPKALLVGIALPGVDDGENQESLAELGRLASTLGFEVVHSLSQRRRSLSGATVVGQGKLKDLARWTGGPGKVESRAGSGKSASEAGPNEPDDQDGDQDHEQEGDHQHEQDGDDDHHEQDADDEHHEQDADDQRHEQDGDDDPNENQEGDQDENQDGEGKHGSVAGEKVDAVLFDCELTPSQMSRLQSALEVEVLDRTGVIVEIFSRQARTREAKLQVEMARLKYLAPRLRKTGKRGSERMQKAGESLVELDRRKIRDRISQLKEEIVAVQKEQALVRQRRAEQHCVALVGYTNAGKSSLMRALTGSQVLVEDKLFATLETTVRSLAPETVPRILISDTVGFIRKLPHDLVASFRSTLEEARNAWLLLYVVDASDPSFRSQLQVTREVMASLGGEEIPYRLVLNKCDKLEDPAALRQEFPEAILMSAKNPADVAALRQRLVEFFEEDMEEGELFVPYSAHGVIGQLRNQVSVVGQRYDEQGTHFRVRGRDLKGLKVSLGL